MNIKSSMKLEWTGYYPGVIGKVTELHAVNYHKNWNFDISFETQVARELSAFFINYRETRDGFWAVNTNGTFAGTVAIDGQLTGTEGARLRWFIVEPERQGLGIGKLLLEKAVTFCRKTGYHKIFLWTFQGLDAARRLYESEGFKLVEEHPVDQWGRKINEQKFELMIRMAI
jgi:GNAT superfamily N-acetyltransferase